MIQTVETQVGKLWYYEKTYIKYEREEREKEKRDGNFITIKLDYNQSYKRYVSTILFYYIISL
jgi:hypothetical protein